MGKCDSCNAALLFKSNSQKPGPGMGARGHGYGGKAEENPGDTGFEKDRVKSKLGKGLVVGSWFSKGEPPSGRALAEYSSAQRTYADEANEALTKQKIPEEYRGYVREYFDSIRIQDRK